SLNIHQNWCNRQTVKRSSSTFVMVVFQTQGDETAEEHAISTKERTAGTHRFHTPYAALKRRTCTQAKAPRFNVANAVAKWLNARLRTEHGIVSRFSAVSRDKSLASASTRAENSFAADEVLPGSGWSGSRHIRGPAPSEAKHSPRSAQGPELAPRSQRHRARLPPSWRQGPKEQGL